MRVPTHILHAAVGGLIPEAQILKMQQQYVVTAPGTGGEECLRLCNLANVVSPVLRV
jgi:hypothetical protein